ncbi:MAG: ABC transporter substrate-binding protein [Nannocystaceae bacterium]
MQRGGNGREATPAPGRRARAGPRRRRCLALLAGLGLGCGGDDGGAPARAPEAASTEAASTEAAETQETAAGDPDAPREPLQLTAVGPTETVFLAVRAVPEALDPFGDLDPWGERVVEDLLFEGLVHRSAEGYPWAVPELASACTLEPTQREVLCHLRPDRTFHDGTPVAVDDVVYSLGLWIGPRADARRASRGLERLSAVEVVDGPADGRGRDPGNWIKLSFDAAEPLALERIAAMKIVPRARHRGRAAAFAREPIGSGPMRLASMDKERVILERADSTPPDRTGAKRIVLVAAPDGAHALTQLRRGEVHVLAEVSPVHVPRELAKAGMEARFRAYLLTPPRFDLLVYNLRSGAQSGPRLRRALASAIPWAALADEIYRQPGIRPAAPVDDKPPAPIDLGLVAQGRLAEAGLGPWLDAPDPAADGAGLAAAAAELDALGWTLERGIRRRSTGQLRLPLMWDGSGGLASEVAAALRGRWRDLGVQVPNVTASWAYLLARPLGAGEFDLALVRYADASESDLHALFHSRGRQNLSGVVDPGLDAAIEAFRAARTPEQRRDAQAAMASRLGELQPVTVLHAPLSILLVSRRITGLTFVDDLPRLDRLGLGGEESDR